jgi:hypothetical protein
MKTPMGTQRTVLMTTTMITRAKVTNPSPTTLNISPMLKSVTTMITPLKEPVGAKGYEGKSHQAS